MSSIDNDMSPGRGTSGIGPALRRGWMIIVIVALAAVAASVYAASHGEPQFEATTNLVLTPLGQGDTSLFGTPLIRDAGNAAQTPNTVAVMIESNAVASGTAGRLGGGWTAASVLDAVRVEPVPNTNVIAVTARTSSATEAAELATAFARSVIDDRRRMIVPLLEERLKVVTAQRRRAPADDYSQRAGLLSEIRIIENTLANDGDPTLRLVEPAVPPRTETKRSVVVTGAIALLGGAAVGCVAAVGLDRLRRPASLRDQPVIA